MNIHQLVTLRAPSPYLTFGRDGDQLSRQRERAARSSVAWLILIFLLLVGCKDRRSSSQPNGATRASKPPRYSTDASTSNIGSRIETPEDNWPEVGSRAIGIALDDLTKYIVLTKANRTIVVYRSLDHSLVNVIANGKTVEAVTARDGYACVTQPNDGLLSCFNLKDPPPGRLASLPIGPSPTCIAMTKLAGTSLVCAEFDSEDCNLTVVNVLDMKVIRRFKIPAITPRPRLPRLSGYWELRIIGQGTNSSDAALVSSADRVLVFINLQRGTQERRASIPGGVYRMVPDDAHHGVIVAFFDRRNGRTRFARANSADGSVVSLAAGTDVLAEGLIVPPDGRNILVYGNGHQIRIPNR